MRVKERFSPIVIQDCKEINHLLITFTYTDVLNVPYGCFEKKKFTFHVMYHLCIKLTYIILYKFLLIGYDTSLASSFKLDYI